MKKIAKEIDVLYGPEALTVDGDSRSYAIALTTNPFVLPLPNTGCYAVLMAALPPTAPVGMMVTYRRYVPQGRTDPAMEVGSVFADRALRRLLTEKGHTISVAVGRSMFDQGLLTLHSPDRTDAGERWARQLGGELPDRDQIGTAEDAEASGQLALDRLNQESWPPAPWPPSASSE